MRKIKFRAWQKTEKRMYYSDEYYHDRWLSIDLKGTVIDQIRDFPEETTDIIPLQYIGRKDKNGKEVCEGDIIDISSFGYINNKIYIVRDVWEFGRDYGYDCNSWEDSEWFIIGNIYENPKLQKEK